MTATSTLTRCPERWGIRLLFMLVLMVFMASCRSPWPVVRSRFPEHKQDTLHLASWWSRSNEAEFTDHLCQDSSLAKALSMGVELFRTHARMRLDARHELYIAETFTGISGTNFPMYIAEKGVDTLRYAAVPYAEAMYADEPVSGPGDVVIADQSDQSWLMDLDRDGDLDYVYSAWSHTCVVVSSRIVPGEGDGGEPRLEFEEECSDDTEVTCYVWDGREFEKGKCPEGSDFERLRLVHEDE